MSLSLSRESVLMDILFESINEMFISFYLGYFIFNKLLVLEYDDGDSDEDSGGIVDLNLMNELEVFILKFRVVVFELKFGVELN